MENQNKRLAKEGDPINKTKPFNKVLESNAVVMKMQSDMQKKIKFKTNMMLAKLDFLIEITRQIKEE